ncbi:MAG: LPS export ABC transporter periplasmic protein LptC [Pseudomonadales bacterium]|jgi:LPS export ABC transporter protein LptC|nr:LPS export ABC transporter periplasmic protein LptC [Pseudomonadales bacterium]
MPKISYLILPGVLAIGLFFITSSFDSRETSVENSSTGFTQEFVAFAEGISTELYDEQGQLSYTLDADRQIQHQDDSSELEAPTIRVYRDSRSSWNIVADSGTISAPAEAGSDNTRVITMAGDVEIRSLDEQGKPLLITTDAVKFLPATEIAETDLPVDFSMPQISQTSLGMRANLASDEIVFLSDSEGRYVQPAN